MSPILRKQVNFVNRIDNEAGDHHHAQAEALFDAIHTVMHLYRARQLRGLRDTPHELTHMEMKALSFFARHPGASQSELVAHSGRDKAQLARLLRGLRDKGLLDAQADEQDKRSTRLRLSPQGQAVFDSLQQMGEDAATMAVAGMSGDERAGLLTLLQRIKLNLETGQQGG
jgi:DNA-binding MarR family transcriptional regulator